MKNFLKVFFGITPKDLNEALRDAVLKDNVEKAYEILSIGIVDVNRKIYYQSEESNIESGTTYPTTEATCLLDKAQSQPMKVLLKHFGAISLEEINQLEAEEHEQQFREANERMEKEAREKKTTACSKS